MSVLVAIFHRSCWNLAFDQRSFQPLTCRSPFHESVVWVVIHIVVRVDRVAEDPEVVHAWQEVEDAELFVLLIADSCEKIGCIDLYPVLFKHEPEVLHALSRLTVDIEDAIVQHMLYAIQIALEESTGHGTWDHAQAESCREDAF